LVIFLNHPRDLIFCRVVVFVDVRFTTSFDFVTANDVAIVAVAAVVLASATALVEVATATFASATYDVLRLPPVSLNPVIISPTVGESIFRLISFL
jgi:hypothetical protein